VGKEATRAERSGPYRRWINGISLSLISRGKSRSMSGIADVSSFRKRPGKSPASTGSTCESPVR